jgi:peptidyl-prolyl cis-trans isomerase A (cyclophilin A)/peptidyl-prolyl cis-trans isomerase B (cyclophilin B)
MMFKLLRHVSMLACAALLALALPAQAANPQVEMDTTLGTIRVELYPDAAPKTVEHFLAYVKSKQFDGTQFHRVIPGFMIQGGGYTADFAEKPTSLPAIPIESEMSKKAGLSNTPGMVSMARTSEPNSANAQFFINVAQNGRLDFREASPAGYGYTVFGKVVSGMDVVDKIAGTPTGPGGSFRTDVPKQMVLIKSVKLITP